MSYDDGKIFDRKFIEIFNKYGIKGKFHLNTGIMPVDEDRIQLSEVKELYKGLRSIVPYKHSPNY